jgi:succinyl-CoA synthetase alpha subunit
MSILINEKTRLVVQGITGRDGAFHTRKMKEYGTNIVAGVSPGKEGTTVEGIPVFNTVENAVKLPKRNTSVIFIPAPFAADALSEASDAGLN